MRATAFLCLVAIAGCSFTMPDAPDRPYRSMPDCETSRAKPVIDMLGAGTALSLALVFALAAAIEDDLGGDDDGELGTAALVSLGAGAVFTVSAIGGFRKGTRCRAAQSEYQTMLYYNPQRPPYPYVAPGPQPQPQPQPQPPPQPQPQPASKVPVGAERGLCRQDGTCDRGLTCASGRCVFLPR